ncbi:MAG TPA: HAMP domain-containing sensor histidine kinase [Polyangiaceae bacterium]|jgi:two-component system phosphate regulon sensor histidine kinase PhoR
MDKARRDRLASFVLLPVVLVAAGIVAYFTARTTFQVEKLRQQSVLEATLALAGEKADRLDKRIIEQDNVVIAIADPAHLDELNERWLPTAPRETPTVRAVVVLDGSRDVLAFASRASGPWSEDESFRRLLVRRMVNDMDLGQQPPDELRHLHHEYGGTSYLVSYWQRVWQDQRYLVVAWHDIGRIVKDALPRIYAEPATTGPGAVAGRRPTEPARVDVVDEDGRIIFGPPLRSGEFTVGVRFPTTLYNWRLQVSPKAAEEITARVQNRRSLELLMLLLSGIVTVAGVATILLAAERERRVSALKSEFVANVSHELKTPLALVRMFGEMLQSGRVASEEKRQEYLGIIVRESERLSNLIENVLDFAKVERGREAYDFADGDVGDAVAKAANVYRYRAEREAVQLAVEIAPQLPMARIDSRAIQLAVINLVDNALKYAPNGERIVIRAAEERGVIAVRVVDQGPGVPVEDRQRIFERFVRGARDGTSARVRGSGIGLALVKQIAESHGGRAWVEDSGEAPSPARGAAFVFTIPPLKARARSASSGELFTREIEGEKASSPRS